MPKFAVLGLCLCATCWCGSTALFAADRPAHAESPNAHPRLGMNLTGPADWDTELPFVDVFHLSRPWTSQQKGGAWGKGPALDLDAHGWVKSLAPDCSAQTLLCTIAGGHYPSGRYTLLYDGKGVISIGGAAKVVAQPAPGRMILDVDSSKGAIFLSIAQTDPSDYIRNIHVIMPGFANTWQQQPFNPVFLHRWQGIACYRFMDWMCTNNSKVVTWDQRPKLNDATWMKQGIPLEMMIDLCNRQHIDPWFCMPCQADDRYIRSFAQMVKEKLDPSLKVYIEYSNEVWNGMFQQHKYAMDQAAARHLGRPDRPWEGACLFYTQRALQIFRIWQDVFGGHDRLVRVLAWQVGDHYWIDGLLLKNVKPGEVDALAIAPYLAMLVPPHSNDPNRPGADEVSKWSVDQLMAYMRNTVLPRVANGIRTNAQMARNHGLRLVAYEAGQHLVGIGGGENNPALTQLFFKANADPRMGELYTAYLNTWKQAGGDLLCNFTSVGSWSKWGCWGLLQYSDENEAASPKFMAVMRWAKSMGQNVNLP